MGYKKSKSSGYGVDAFADWPNFGIAGWAGGIIILYFMMQMASQGGSMSGIRDTRTD